MIGNDLNDKAPSSVAWFTYAWAWFVAFVGSLAHHIEKVRTETHEQREQRRRGGFFYWCVDLLSDLITGAFVGLMMFYILEAYHVNKDLSAAIIGISANMSGRMLEFLRGFISKRIGAL